MEKKSQKAYEKAMKLYEEGNMDKALAVCENALSEELNNSSLLNFKGLLLYQQGKLNEAITVWKLNYEFNKDHIAENYIKDAQGDFERLELYNNAKDELKNLNIDKALNILLSCAISDFNSIKVNTDLAVCYERKGQYNKAATYVDKALKLDKNYQEAIKVKKELNEFIKINKNKSISKKLLTIVTILFIFILLGGAGFAIYMRINNEHLFNNGQSAEQAKTDNNSKQNITVKSNNDKKDDNKKDNNIEKNNKIDKNEEKTFDKDAVEKLIANSDVDGLCEKLKGIDKNKIPSEDMYLYRQAVELIQKDGVINYYNKGLEYYNEKNYENAETEFDKAYEFSENNSYREHISFYRASNLAKLMKTEDAIKQYEEYYKEYPDGVYTEGVLYELVFLYSSTDKSKSKQYARDLINKFPQSIYINDDIKNILNE